ncbi:MAG TPA: reverse transcriptase family protein [Pirellulales bacterium]|nr:reverse transcriptase family protein [Pirellulales bacterium]
MAERLATAFLAGPWDADLLYERGAHVLESKGHWLKRLARQIHARGEGRGALRRRWVTEWICENRTFLWAWNRYDLAVDTHLWHGRQPLRPAPGPPSAWKVPSISTTRELIDWLGIKPNELDWFADCRNCQRRAPEGALRHYRYHWLPKRRGPPRLLEIPKPRLRELQRQILRRLLDNIPAHDAAHGFRAGRCVRSFAAPHAGQRVVVRMDLQSFFPSIRAGRLLGLFLAAGYPESVALLLTRLCTHRAASDVFEQITSIEDRTRLETLYGWPHLPQGAPTSPALANLAAWRLDCRLAALAAASGANYTRYADDLAFSGGPELERAARRFHVEVAAIALEEGFAVNTRKTRIMRAGVRQHLAGVVVNRHPNLDRNHFDRLKAILHNCVAQGPKGQNCEGRADFRAYLAGSIAYAEMINPARGRRLRALFDAIVW